VTGDRRLLGVDYRVRSLHPADVSATEFERRLWEDTERSLRQDPSRWPWRRASDTWDVRSRVPSDEDVALRRQVAKEEARRRRSEEAEERARYRPPRDFHAAARKAADTKHRLAAEREAAAAQVAQVREA
jgi:hypothetical protein